MAAQLSLPSERATPAQGNEMPDQVEFLCYEPIAGSVSSTGVLITLYCSCLFNLTRDLLRLELRNHLCLVFYFISSDEDCNWCSK